MSLYIGIDLGTSSMKLLLMDREGQIKNIVSKDYPLEFPQPGWSQQNPGHWEKALLEGIPELLKGFDAGQVAGIGCGGQMHGLVVLDEADRVIRPAILWNDGRTAAQVDYLNEVIGREKLSAMTANIAFAGFTAPKILWMKEQEPENYGRIAKIMLPKDYVNYILTGIHACDYSDASGMLLLDVEHKCWSKEMLEICGISEKQMPGLFESFAPIGTLKPDMAEKLGLPESVIVCAGAGDNAAAAVGTGVVGEGGCNISLGTSGTVFISAKSFGVDPNNALHAFAHADGGWHLMGCMLSAASCNKWLLEDILGTRDYSGEQQAIASENLGRNHVYFRVAKNSGAVAAMADSNVNSFCFKSITNPAETVELKAGVTCAVRIRLVRRGKMGESAGYFYVRELCGFFRFRNGNVKIIFGTDKTDSSHSGIEFKMNVDSDSEPFRFFGKLLCVMKRICSLGDIPFCKVGNTFRRGVSENQNWFCNAAFADSKSFAQVGNTKPVRSGFLKKRRGHSVAVAVSVSFYNSHNH